MVGLIIIGVLLTAGIIMAMPEEKSNGKTDQAMIQLDEEIVEAEVVDEPDIDTLLAEAKKPVEAE